MGQLGGGESPGISCLLDSNGPNLEACPTQSPAGSSSRGKSQLVPRYGSWSLLVGSLEGNSRRHSLWPLQSTPRMTQITPFSLIFPNAVLESSQKHKNLLPLPRGCWSFVLRSPCQEILPSFVPFWPHCIERRVCISHTVGFL